VLASRYFDIRTTAVYSGSISICLPYDESVVGTEQNLKLMHWNGAAWEDVTTSLNTADNVICGSVSSLSVFAVMERTCNYLGDMNCDGAIDISDVILVLRIALQLDPPQPCSDINADGGVDISDVILTLRMALQLDQWKPCN
jgi:hypothetical protein